MAEGQEGLPRESVISRISRLKNRLLGRSPQPQAPQTAQPISAELNQPAGVTPREAARKLETGQATEMFKPFGAEITPPSQQPPPETTAGWVKHEYERTQASIQKTPDQLAEEARIDAANLAKAQQPTGPLPKVSPFTQPTTLPEKVFGPQPEIPGEHTEVDEFLKTKPQPTTETSTQPPETAAQAPTGEAIPVQSQPQEEQPIPVNIPQRTPVNVGDEVR